MRKTLTLIGGVAN